MKRELAAGTPCLVVDGGDIGANRGLGPWDKATFLFGKMAELGYDAVTPGEFELSGGVETAAEFYDAHPEIRVVSANIRDKQGRLVWPESVVIEKDGVRFGVTGVTASAPYDYNVKRGIQKADDFDFEDPLTALNRVLPALQERSNVLVVLLHDGPGNVKRLARELEVPAVIVAGHNPGYTPEPLVVSDSYVVQPGNRGQFVSVLNLVYDETGKIVLHAGEGVPLDDRVAKDSQIGEAAALWEKEWKARNRQPRR